MIRWALVVGALCQGSAIASELTLSFLDVGQGDAVLLECGSRYSLVDAGRGGKTADQLRALKVKRLDYVIGTHPHSDHIGGIDEVLERIPVGTFIDNGQSIDGNSFLAVEDVIRDRKIRRKHAKAGMRLRLCAGVSMTVLWPAGLDPLEGEVSQENAQSVVLLIRNKAVKVLLTGDMERVVDLAPVPRTTRLGSRPGGHYGHNDATKVHSRI